MLLTAVSLNLKQMIRQKPSSKRKNKKKLSVKKKYLTHEYKSCMIAKVVTNGKVC